MQTSRSLNCWFERATSNSDMAACRFFKNGIRMQETANKQKRITLKTVHEMLNGMDFDHYGKV